MWVSPNHPNPPKPRIAKVDDGEPLGTFPRPGTGEELRITLNRFKGHAYLGLQVWERDAEGLWWPRKGQGVSIRAGEAKGVIKALQAGLPALKKPKRPAGKARAEGNPRPAARLRMVRDGIAPPPGPNLPASAPFEPGSFGVTSAA